MKTITLAILESYKWCPEVFELRKNNHQVGHGTRTYNRGNFKDQIRGQSNLSTKDEEKNHVIHSSSE